MKNISFTIIIFITIFTQLNAQDLSFEKIGITEGLPHYYVQTVFEDNEGFLWIGTVAGLVKYNGYTMKIYTVKDGLNSNNIIKINQDKNNTIWIATDKGVVRFSNEKFTSYTLDSTNIQSTKQIYIDSKNNVLAANLAGVFVYNSTINVFEPHPSMGNTYTRTIIEDNSNNLWFGGKSGLYKTEGDTIKQISIPGPNHKRQNSIITSFKDFNNNIWFGTASGFVRVKDNSIAAFNQSLDLEDVYMSLFQLKDSTYTFGTYGGGFIHFKNPTDIKRQKLDGSISSNTVSTITQTRGGTVWLATGQGLLKSNTNNFTENINFTDSINSLINAIEKDYENNIWLATDNGVKKYNKKTHTLQSFNLSDSENENNVLCMYSDVSDSSIYFGTHAGRCYKYKNNIFTTFADDDYWMEGHSIYGITKDRENNIWISKNLRVIKCFNDSIITIQIDSLNNGAYETLIENDRVWFVGSNGIHYLDGQQVKKLKKINKVPLDYTRQIEIDKNNTIWFGTLSNGIFKYKNGKGTQITTENGLSSNVIQSLKYDKNRNCLWVGTLNGISQIKLDSISNILNINTFKNINIQDCNVNSSFVDNENGIYIAVNDKLYNFNSKKEINNLPVLKISDILLFQDTCNFLNFSDGKTKDNLPKNLVLPYNQNHITFNYFGIELNEPNQILYSVKLEGFDATWSKPNNTLSTTYTSLLPNKYTFKLKAQNSHGIWSESYDFSFIITPPYYKRRWFILLTTIILGTLFFTLIKLKINKVKKTASIEKNIAELELKALRAQMNPHFIFNIMNNIQNFVVTEQTNKAIQLLGDFATLIRSILDISSDKTIILSKEIEFLTTYINLDLTQYPNKYKYDFSFTNNIDKDNILIPPILIQPFVENAILHGLMHKNGLGVLKISFSQTQNALICVIEDNGVGRIKSKEISINKQDHKSKALNISKDRINQFNTIEKSKQYNITITDLIDNNNIGIGTKVTVEIPLKLKY